MDTDEAYQRYATLVDKKFDSSLTETEKAELLRLEVYLDEVESSFYQPVHDRLHDALTAAEKSLMPLRGTQKLGKKVAARPLSKQG